MSEQKKTMSGLLKVVIGMGVLAVVAALVGGTIAMGYISAYNEGNETEKQISFLNQESENRLSHYTVSIQEIASIPDAYKEGLKDVLKSTLEARYGDTGNKSAISFIKEHSVNFDSKLYENVQRAIKSGREEFRISQTRKIEVCRNYQTSLGYLWKGTFMKWAGYPKLNLADVCAIVSDEGTVEAFKTKKTSPIKLN